MSLKFQMMANEGFEIMIILKNKNNKVQVNLCVDSNVNINVIFVKASCFRFFRQIKLYVFVLTFYLDIIRQHFPGIYNIIKYPSWNYTITRIITVSKIVYWKLDIRGPWIILDWYLWNPITIYHKYNN